MFLSTGACPRGDGCNFRHISLTTAIGGQKKQSKQFELATDPVDESDDESVTSESSHASSLAGTHVSFIATVKGNLQVVTSELLAELLLPTVPYQIVSKGPGKFAILLNKMAADQFLAERFSSTDQLFLALTDGSGTFSVRVFRPRPQPTAGKPFSTFSSKMFCKGIISEARVKELFPEVADVCIQVQGAKREYSLIFKSKRRADQCFARVAAIAGAEVKGFKVDVILDGRPFALFRARISKADLVGPDAVTAQQSSAAFNSSERLTSVFMNAQIVDGSTPKFAEYNLKSLLLGCTNVSFPKATAKFQNTMRIFFGDIRQAKSTYQALAERSRNEEGHALITCGSQSIELHPPVTNFELRMCVASIRAISIGRKSLTSHFVPTTKKFHVSSNVGELDIITVLDSSTEFLDQEGLADENIKIDYLYSRQVELQRISDSHKCGFRFTRIADQKQRLEVFGLLDSLPLARRECLQLAAGVALKRFHTGPTWTISAHFARLLETILSGFSQLRFSDVQNAPNDLTFTCCGPRAALQEFEDAFTTLSPLTHMLTIPGANMGLLSPEKNSLLNSMLLPNVRYDRNGTNKIQLFALSQEDLDNGIQNVTSWQAQTLEGMQQKEEKLNIDDSNIFKFISAHQPTWLELKHVCESHNLVIRKPRVGTEDQYISVTGKQQDLKAALPKLRATLSAIVQSFISKSTVLTPGAFGVFEDDSFQEELSKCAELRGVSVRAADVEHEVAAANLLRQVTVNGITIEIRQGDIVNDSDVDAVVIAAGSHLEHGGGVAARVALAAGPGFITECKSYILEHASLAETKSHVFDAHNLDPVDHIIASVPPVFFPTTSPAAASQNLLKTFVSCFAEADAAGVKRLATPALGASLFKNPLNLVLAAFFKAVTQLSPQSTLTVVRLTDIDTSVLTEACKLFDASYKDVAGYRKWSEPKGIDQVKIKQPKYLWDVEIQEQKNWLRYDDDSHAIIDSNYQLDPTSSFALLVSVSDSSKGHIYEIDFNNMIQTNKASGFKRKIRFAPNPAALLSDDDDDTKDDDASSHASSDVTGDRQVAVSYLATELESKLLAFLRLLNASRLWGSKVLSSHIKGFKLTQDLEKTIQLACKNNLVDAVMMPDGKSVQLKGSRERVIDMVEIILPLLNPEVEVIPAVPYPPHWTLPQDDALVLVSLVDGSPEWSNVEALLRRTLPNIKVAKIDRIQNKQLWENFHHNIRRMKARLQHDPVVSQMFHGTSSNDPKLIYGDIHHDGFHTNFSRAGMWGRGTYFAVNASYSGGSYAYNMAGGQKQMMLCQVLVGDSIKLPSDSSIVLPPIKPGANAERYDSVTGNTGGSDVVIVYDNGRAYPEYLITFTN